MSCLAQTDIWLQSAYEGSDQILISQVMSITQCFSALRYGSLPQLCSWLRSRMRSGHAPSQGRLEKNHSVLHKVSQPPEPETSTTVQATERTPAPAFGLRLFSVNKYCRARLRPAPLSSWPRSGNGLASASHVVLSQVALLGLEKPDAVGLHVLVLQSTYTGNGQSYG